MANYKFGKKIGSGGFGLVRHATRTEDGLPFAVKHLLDQYKDDEEIVERFRREVRMQRGLEHPNILPVVGANLSASPPWFIMPIAERTLADEIEDGLEDDRVIEIFRGVLTGVAYAHENGIIHRDLKPENVMMSHDGIPQVSDFGLGKNLLSDSTALTKTYLGAGSFPYVAPEQMISLRDADGRADVYALGKVLQAMVTQKLPVLADDHDVPRKYQYLIAKCTAQREDQRYQTLEEVADAFEQTVRGVEEPEPPRDVAMQIIEGWMTTEVGPDREVLRAFHEHLERNADDGTLYRVVLPQVPEGMLTDYVEDLPTEFRRVLRTYDEHISGSLDFDYCDVAADFYRRVYRMADDLDMRRLILARLIDMGAYHNRFHVGDVVASILAGIDETAEAMMAVDVLRADARNAAWFKENPNLRAGKLAPPIDDVLFGEI